MNQKIKIKGQMFEYGDKTFCTNGCSFLTLELAYLLQCFYKFGFGPIVDG